MNEFYGVKAAQGLDRANLQAALSNQTVGIKPPQPPVSRLFESLKRMHEVGLKLSDVADKLVGSAEQGDGPGAIPVVGGGAFGEIDRAAYEIDTLVETMMGHLSRIERRL